MAGESIGCASRKKSKNKKDDKAGKNENNSDLSKIAQPSKTTRGGLRVYKIVILGDGGVGKSGRWNIYIETSNLHTEFPISNQRF